MPVTGAAAVRLYDDHVDAVYAMVARRVGTALASRTTGEAFEYALRTWERFDPQRGTERLFLLGAATVAIRQHEAAERAHLQRLRLDHGDDDHEVNDPLLDDLRRHDRSRDVLADDDIAHTDRDRLDDGDDARTMAAVADLDPDDRNILLLSLWEAFSQAEIAETLHMPVSAVRSALGRIRRELKITVSGSDA